MVFLLLITLSLSGLINSPMALALGFIYTLFFKNPYLKKSKKGIQSLLKLAVIGLGFGIVATEAISASSKGIILIVTSILLIVVIGMVLANRLGISKSLGFLITSGTAICGGSAIAAISPIVKADNKTISISLAIVFTLNSIALLIFPSLGHFFNLTQEQFGLWSATAIHDTSSVVGAALNYGDEALKVATTLKLSRALWIIPLSLFSIFLFKAKGKKVKVPYFILGFVVAIIINSYNILPDYLTKSILFISKRILILTLFLIGTTLSIKEIKKIGVKPLLFAVSLWVFISVFSLIYIINLN